MIDLILFKFLCIAKTKKLQNLETTALLIEVNNDYARTMNKIIFDRFLEDNFSEMGNRDLFPVLLALPAQNQEKEAPEMGINKYIYLYAYINIYIYIDYYIYI